MLMGCFDLEPLRLAGAPLANDPAQELLPAGEPIDLTGHRVEDALQVFDTAIVGDRAGEEPPLEAGCPSRCAKPPDQQREVEGDGDGEEYECDGQVFVHTWFLTESGGGRTAALGRLLGQNDGVPEQDVARRKKVSAVPANL